MLKMRGETLKLHQFLSDMTSVSSVSQFLSCWFGNFPTWGNKRNKILYIHLWKWCKTEAKSSNVYRCYHGDTTMSQVNEPSQMQNQYFQELWSWLILQCMVFNEAWIQNMYFFLLDSFHGKNHKGSLGD